MLDQSTWFFGRFYSHISYDNVQFGFSISYRHALLSIRFYYNNNLKIFKKENIFQAHSNHFYQKILKKGYTHEYVLKKIIYLNLILLMLSILSNYYPITSFVLAFCCTSSLIIFFNTRKFK